MTRQGAPERSKWIHLPGMNGVRFLAALLVVLDHLEQFKPIFGIDPLWSVAHSTHLGRTGVTIFFVLSGFLITYLLLKEKTAGPIHIRNFYIRRVLRIWPLYFLIVVIGFFIAPHVPVFDIEYHQVDVMAEFPWNFALFAGMLANFAFAFLVSVPFANVLWSVAVEEQFYLFWPHVIAKATKVLKGILMVLGAFMVIKLLTVTLLVNRPEPLASGFYTLVDRTRFSCMMIGGLAAYAAHVRWGLLMRSVFHTATQWMAWAAMGIMVLSIGDSVPFRLFGHEVTAVITAVLLLNLAFNKKTLLRLDGPVLDRLGRVSYGIYVYHLFVVVACIKGFRPLYDAFPGQASLLHVALLIVTLSITVLISGISYRYYELWFLRRKKDFSTIVSGDLAR